MIYTKHLTFYICIKNTKHVFIATPNISRVYIYTKLTKVYIFFQDIERRDSIPETIPEGKPVVTKKNIPVVSLGLGIPDIPEKNENCTCVCTCNEGSNGAAHPCESAAAATNNDATTANKTCHSTS